LKSEEERAKLQRALGWVMDSKKELNDATEIVLEYVTKTSKGCYWYDFQKFCQALWKIVSANSNLCKVKDLIEEVLKSEDDEE